MPCRARAAAQSSLQCLWITDEILAETFQRFARVSHTSRRYGSTVPGPLEARRRLAKRRLGLSAAAVTANVSALPSVDIGSWFAWPPPLSWSLLKPWEKKVKYEPPDSPRSAVHARLEKEDGGDLVSNWLPRRRSDKVNIIEEASQEVDWTATVLQIPKDPIGESRAAFDALLRDHDEENDIVSGFLGTMIDFLQDSRNEPEAYNTLRLIQWLKSRAAVVPVISQLSELLKGKISLLSITENELAQIVLELLPQRSSRQGVVRLSPENHSQFIATVLTDMIDSRPEMCHSVVLNVTNRILMNTDREEKRSTLDSWLVCLTTSTHNMLRKSTSTIKKEVYSTIAPHVKPSELLTHFSPMREDILVDTIARHWVSRGYIDPIRSPIVGLQEDQNHVTEASPDLLLLRTSDIMFLSPYTSLLGALAEPAKPEYLLKDYQGKRRRWSFETGVAAWRKHRMIDLVEIVHRRRLPYSNLLYELFTLYRHKYGTDLTEVMFWDLHHRGKLDIPKDFALHMLNKAIEEDRFQFAMRIFKHFRNISLVDCRDLPVRLIEHKKMSASALFMMLNRQTDYNVASNWRNGRVFRALDPRVADAVPLIAYSLAKSPHLEPRTAFRRVWECFRFLRGNRSLSYRHHTSRSTLIGRAFVKAGITRYFEERQPLSKNMTEYIVSMVGKIEGDEEARKLDRLIFDIHRSYVQAGPDSDRRFLHRRINDRDADNKRAITFRIKNYTTKPRRYRGWWTIERRHRPTRTHTPIVRAESQALKGMSIATAMLERPLVAPQKRSSPISSQPIEVFSRVAGAAGQAPFFDSHKPSDSS